MSSAPTEIGALIPPADTSVVIEYHVLPDESRTEIIHLTQPSTHLFVHVENRAKALIIVWLEGDIANHAAEVILGDEAQCTIVTINAAHSDAQIHIRQRSRIGNGSSCTWQNMTLGGAAVDHDLVSQVIGDDGNSAIEWMFYAKGTEKQSLTVRNIFDGLRGTGEILMRGIAEQKGHTVCKGMIDIGLKGGGTNTYLTQEVLMLDSTSKVDAIPALEIKTNDVKASHSATVARVTEEDLFYFGARGIAPQDARRMFVLGFLGDIAGRITDAETREKILAAVEEKYGVKNE